MKTETIHLKTLNDEAGKPALERLRFAARCGTTGAKAALVTSVKADVTCGRCARHIRRHMEAV